MRIRPIGPTLGQVVRFLHKAGSVFADCSPLMRQIAGILAGATEGAFAAERSPDGKAWAPLALSTTRAVIHGRARGAHPILQVSGQLAASVHTAYGADYAEIGTNKVYAAIQQFGGAAGRNLAAQLPARPYIGLGATHLTSIMEAAQRFVGTRLDS